MVCQKSWKMVVWAMLATVFSSVNITLATEIGGSFEQDGMHVDYGAWDIDDPANREVGISLTVNSAVRPNERAWVTIHPDKKVVRDDGLPAFQGALLVSGLDEGSLSWINRSSSLNYQSGGVYVNQSTSVWWDISSTTQELWNGAAAEILLAPVVVDWNNLDYYQWSGGGGGKGVVPIETSGWIWELQFGGYFLDQIEGEKYLASIPEPMTATLGFLAFGAMFLRRRRH
jgi:hypothetical protein